MTRHDFRALLRVSAEFEERVSVQKRIRAAWFAAGRGDQLDNAAHRRVVAQRNALRRILTIANHGGAQ